MSLPLFDRFLAPADAAAPFDDIALIQAMFDFEAGLARAQAGAVAGEQRLADLIHLDFDLRLRGGEEGTCRDAHQVARERQLACLVEVVDSPHLTSS